VFSSLYPAIIAAGGFRPKQKWTFGKDSVRIKELFVHNCTTDTHSLEKIVLIQHLQFAFLGNAKHQRQLGLS
jgi:hypothetical protein